MKKIVFYRKLILPLFGLFLLFLIILQNQSFATANPKENLSTHDKNKNVQRKYYDNGKLKSETRYLPDGSMEGAFYFDNGQLQSETYLKNNYQDMRQKEYNKNGTLLREFEQINGKQIKNEFYCNEKMEQIFAQWVQTAEDLSFTKLWEVGLTDEEMEILKNVGLTGQLEIRGNSEMGRECRASRVVFIFQKSITSPVELNLPKATSMIYLQNDSNWQKLPAEAPTSDRTIRFELDKNIPGLILESSELESGARQGGSINLQELGDM